MTTGKLYVTGEHISAGSSVVCSVVDGKVYAAGDVGGDYVVVPGEHLGEAAEELRDGFRVCLRPDGDIYEDDA